MSANYERFCEILAELLQTPSDDLKTARKLWLELKPLLDRLRVLQSGGRLTETELLISELEKAATKFLRSLNASTGPLRSEWKKLASVDLERFKDSASAFYEHVTERKEKFREALNRISFLINRCSDPYRIFDELREAGAICEHTWLLLKKYKNSELHAPQVQKQMDLLAHLLFELKEAERIAVAGR